MTKPRTKTGVRMGTFLHEYASSDVWRRGGELKPRTELSMIRAHVRSRPGFRPWAKGQSAKADRRAERAEILAELAALHEPEPTSEDEETYWLDYDFAEWDDDLIWAFDPELEDYIWGEDDDHDDLIDASTWEECAHA